MATAGSRVVTVAQQKGGSGKTTLAVTLAVGLVRRGFRVALLDTDPQGSLGRWFMARRGTPAVTAAGMAGGVDGGGMDFSTASAWGVSYECEKLRRLVDVVIVDTPPKVDADLRPALREADLVLVPVASSHVDLWATEGVLDLCARERRGAVIVLNRAKAGTRLSGEVALAAEGLAQVSGARLGNRVAFAEALGLGLGAQEMAGAGPALREAGALVDDVLERLGLEAKTE